MFAAGDLLVTSDILIEFSHFIDIDIHRYSGWKLLLALVCVFSKYCAYWIPRCLNWRTLIKLLDTIHIFGPVLTAQRTWLSANLTADHVCVPPAAADNCSFSLQNWAGAGGCRHGRDVRRYWEQRVEQLTFLTHQFIDDFKTFLQFTRAFFMTHLCKWWQTSTTCVGDCVRHSWLKCHLYT